MSSIVASEVWNELKRYVNTVDRQEAAETLVAVLIDHDEDVENIRDAFKHDSDVKRALTAYLDNDKSYDDDEEDLDEDFDEDSNDDWDH
jgi:hypothetical protein